MAERLKSSAESADYHVMIRTAQNEFWMAQHGFKEIVEEILEAFSNIYHIRVIAYCLLDNHFHLVLTVQKTDLDPEDIERRFALLQQQNKRRRKWQEYLLERTHERFTDLSWFMWEINKRLATRFNRIRGTKGHFWGGRYKSKLIENDEYLATALSYVDQNAVEAGIVEKPSDYPYCTSGKIKKALEEGKTPPELPPASFLSQYMGEARAKAWLEAQDKLALYRKSVKAHAKKQQNTIQEPVIKGFDPKAWFYEMKAGNLVNQSGQIYGSEAYINQVKACGLE